MRSPGSSRALAFPASFTRLEWRITKFNDQITTTQGSTSKANGGPGYATMVPGMHLYQNAMTFDRMGYACAIGVALFLVILGITYLNMKYLRASTEYAG